MQGFCSGGHGHHVALYRAIPKEMGGGERVPACPEHNIPLVVSEKKGRTHSPPNGIAGQAARKVDYRNRVMPVPALAR